METNHTHSPIWIKRWLIKCSECGETLKEPRDCWLKPLFINWERNDNCQLWNIPKWNLKQYVYSYHPDYYSTLLSVLWEYE